MKICRWLYFDRFKVFIRFCLDKPKSALYMRFNHSSFTFRTYGASHKTRFIVGICFNSSAIVWIRWFHSVYWLFFVLSIKCQFLLVFSWFVSVTMNENRLSSANILAHKKLRVHNLCNILMAASEKVIKFPCSQYWLRIIFFSFFLSFVWLVLLDFFISIFGTIDSDYCHLQQFFPASYFKWWQQRSNIFRMYTFIYICMDGWMDGSLILYLHGRISVTCVIEKCSGLVMENVWHGETERKKNCKDKTKTTVEMLTAIFHWKSHGWIFFYCLQHNFIG